MFTLLLLSALSQSPAQPRISVGPNEPDWVAILRGCYGLSMTADLLNPIAESDRIPGLFRKAGPGPVRYTPVIALGLETVNRGGWYTPGLMVGKPEKKELWHYQFKNTGRDLEKGEHLPPPLLDGSTLDFDPGDGPFGLWISNDGLNDGGAYTQPAVVKAVNMRLSAQPYKAMIYPYRDPTTHEIVPHSYLIGWEYSTNDDFQDVVTRVDNVILLGADR